jgi:hypothetical protein
MGSIFHNASPIFKGLSLSIRHLCFLKVIHCLIVDQVFCICFDNPLFYFVCTILKIILCVQY